VWKYTKYRTTQTSTSDLELYFAWTKVSKKRGCLHRKTTHGKLNTARKTAIGLIPLPTSNHYSALSDEDSSEHHQKSKIETIPKPPLIFVSNVTTISPLIQLIEHIAKQQYDIKALSGNQIRVQPKTPDAYRTIVKALEEKNTTFHTYKPKDECSYRVVLKNMHFSIDPEEIKYEIENSAIQSPISTTSGKTRLSSRCLWFLWISNLSQTIRTYFKSNTYSSAKSHLNRPNKKGILHDVPTVNDMGTQRITVTTHQDARNAPTRNALAMSVASYVMINTPQTTRAVWSTRTCKRRHFPLFARKYTSHLQTSHTQPGVTYSQIANSNSYSRPQTETEPLLKQPNQHQQPY
jgi:hypothetical protein